MSDQGPSFIDEYHQRIVEFAEDFLDEEERGEFVDGLMERHGYEKVTNWGPPAPQGGRGGGGGNGRRKPLVGQRRPQGGGRGGSGRSSPFQRPQ
jgi:hypothetical protein